MCQINEVIALPACLLRDSRERREERRGTDEHGTTDPVAEKRIATPYQQPVVLGLLCRWGRTLTYIYYVDVQVVKCFLRSIEEPNECGVPLGMRGVIDIAHVSIK